MAIRAVRGEQFFCSGFVVDQAGDDAYIATAGECVDPDAAGNREGLIRAAVINHHLPTDYVEELVQTGVSGGWGFEGLQRTVEVIQPEGFGGIHQSTPAQEVRLQRYDQGDNALLKVSLLKVSVPTRPKPLVIADKGPEPGEPLTVIGIQYLGNEKGGVAPRKPISIPGTASSGAGAWTNEAPFIEINAPLRHRGMSGGPTINKTGEVLGVTSVTSEDPPKASITSRAALSEFLTKNGVHLAQLPPPKSFPWMWVIVELVLAVVAVALMMPLVWSGIRKRRQQEAPAAVEQEKITVLFAAADPTDASRLRLGEEIRNIQQMLQSARYRDRYRLVERFSIRVPDLTQAILDEKPRVVHFSGHGTSTGALCFESVTGEMQGVAPEALAGLFRVAGGVECVLLNACFSAAQAQAIAKVVPFVVGMKKEIGDSAAIAFSVGFYQALGAGRSIPDAFKFGVVQLELRNIPESLTPQLLSQKSTVF